MLSIKSRLLAAEEEFVSALTRGEHAVLEFNERWEALVEELNGVYDSAELEPELCTLAHTTAVRVAALADASIDVFNSCDSVAVRLMDQLDTLMFDLTLHDTPSPIAPSPSLLPSLLASRTPSPSCLKANYSDGRKRRRSESSDCGPYKRKRYVYGLLAVFRSLTHVHPSLSTATATSLNSTMTKTDSRPRFPIHAKTSLSVPQELDTIRRPLKRRMSDADTMPPKGSKRLHIGPRLHAVSDSFTTRPPAAIGFADLPSPDAYLLQDPVTHIGSSLPLEICALVGPPEPFTYLSTSGMLTGYAMLRVRTHFPARRS